MNKILPIACIALVLTLAGCLNAPNKQDTSTASSRTSSSIGASHDFSAPPTLPADASVVTLTTDGLTPSLLKIHPGDNVCWINQDTVIRLPLYAPNSEETLQPGSIWCLRFLQAGTWTFDDRFKRGSAVDIVVE